MKSHDIRAVFFDVDGTLTSFTTHEVPASTITALQRLRECGVLVFICTGRAPSQFASTPKDSSTPGRSTAMTWP